MVQTRSKSWMQSIGGLATLLLMRGAFITTSLWSTRLCACKSPSSSFQSFLASNSTQNSTLSVTLFIKVAALEMVNTGALTKLLSTFGLIAHESS